MVVQAMATRAAANAARRVFSQQPKRSFAGHAKAHIEWTGVDKIVRGYFPEDYQCTYWTILGQIDAENNLHSKGQEDFVALCIDMSRPKKNALFFYHF